MKMKEYDYNKLRESCMNIIKQYNLHPHMVKNISLAWVVFHKAAQEYELYKFYDDYNDSHIETALKKIFKK